MPLRPCLVCGRLTHASRCPEHERMRRAKYRGDWPELARRTIAAHVGAHGWTCPGWGVEPHESRDLTCDHVVDGDATQVQVLCRPCNTRKRHTGR